MHSRSVLRSSSSSGKWLVSGDGLPGWKLCGLPLSCWLLPSWRCQGALQQQRQVGRKSTSLSWYFYYKDFINHATTSLYSNHHFQYEYLKKLQNVCVCVCCCVLICTCVQMWMSALWDLTVMITPPVRTRTAPTCAPVFTPTVEMARTAQVSVCT